MNIQGWFPLELTGLISLQSKGLSRVFSSTTIQKHQFFSIQPSLWFNFHICTWLLENHGFDYMHFCGQSDSKGNEPNQLVTKSCLTLQPHENCQAPLYMGLSRQEYWSGLTFPTPSDLPDPVTEPSGISCISCTDTVPPGKPPTY